MKYSNFKKCGKRNTVAPLAGAWIEMSEVHKEVTEGLVAPLAGAWIEIYLEELLQTNFQESLPSRERGLKYGNQ